MSLQQILALKPADGADAAACADALAAAQDMRAKLAATAAEAESIRAGNLLETDDKTLLAAERKAAEARLDIERIDLLLPAIQAALHAATGREAVAELFEAAKPIPGPIAAIYAWRDDVLPGLLQKIIEGMEIEAKAYRAIRAYEAAVTAACLKQDVRDALPEFDKLPDFVLTGHLPSQFFPMWRKH